MVGEVALVAREACKCRNAANGSYGELLGPSESISREKGAGTEGLIRRDMAEQQWVCVLTGRLNYGKPLLPRGTEEKTRPYRASLV